jgi:hypothetical protein
MLANLYRQQIVPDRADRVYLYNGSNKAWQLIEYLSSRSIREIKGEEQCERDTKVLHMTNEAAALLYAKIDKMRNIANKTKLLRLVHGDVYCNVRMKKYKMTDNDRCNRCFQAETIRHLLLECPYTVTVWDTLGITHNTPEDIIHGGLGQAELELRADLISSIVFRKQILEPQVLIHTTVTKFSRGLSRTKGVTQYATELLTRYGLRRH